MESLHARGVHGPNVAPPGGAAGHLCLALSASNSFLNFEEAVRFYSFSLTILFYMIAISGF